MNHPTPQPPTPASPEQLLRDVRANLMPKAGAQDRVKRMMQSQLRASHLLNGARESLEPAPGLMSSVWSHILSSIDPLRHLSPWERMRQSLHPSGDTQQFGRFSPRLEPAYARVMVSRPVKWVAAFAVLLIAVRISPLLFLAPASIAESSVILFSSGGDVEVLMDSLWQPMRGEITLNAPTTLQTQQGQATITDHDDAVFRFASHTQGRLADLSDRPEASSQETTVTLDNGELWVLGLVPKYIRGITVVTAQGRILVHEGSVSIRQSGDEVVVRVFDRSAVVSRHGEQLSLVTGEQAVLTKDGELVATMIDPAVFHDESWVATNLSRDAAHQREIAQLQQERRASGAGILPGNAFYSVKRLAENVDVLFSLSEEERARKLITQANTRLNEAAALLQNGGDVAAQDAIQQYKDTLLSVASGSGGSPAVQSLLQTQVADAGAATVGAALPGDQAYVLKRAVDDTIASLPDTIVKHDQEGEVLLDELAALKRQAAQGETQQVKEKFAELSDSIASLQGTGSLSLVSPDIREEAKAVALQVAAAVEEPALNFAEGPMLGISLILGVPEKEVVVPQHPARNVIIRPMTAEQVSAKAQEIRGRVFFFGTKKAQYDALDDQLALLVRYPDRGSILRELSSVLPRNGLAQRVVREIETLQQEVQEQVTTASGGVAQ